MKKLTDLKPEEKDEILSFLGFEDFDNFKDTFPTKFLTKEAALEDNEIVSRVTARRVSEIASKALPVFKLVDPEFSLNKLKEGRFEDHLLTLEEKAKATLSELKDKASAGNDKKLADLEKALEDKDKSILSYKELNERVSNEFESYKSETGNSIKSFKINHQLEQAKNKIQWVDDMTDVQRTGYNALLSSKYQFDIDEKDNIVVVGKDGKRIQSKNKADFATIEEILELEAEQNKLIKKNNAKSGNNPIFVQRSKNDKQLPANYLNRVGR
jgi:hypothetical protein